MTYFNPQRDFMWILNKFRESNITQFQLKMEIYFNIIDV